MNTHRRRAPFRYARWSLWLMGLGSLGWLLLRSGTKPQRLAYPCQQAALATSTGFVGYLLSLVSSFYFYHRLRRKLTPARVILFLLACMTTLLLHGSTFAPARHLQAAAALPSWTSASAVSDVFVVTHVPEPECSLNGGALPATSPCNQPDYALHDNGVDALIALMASEGTHFYRSIGAILLAAAMWTMD